MADNEPKEKTALNSPESDNSNVDKKTNTDVPPVEDPLTKRDTDTGSLDKMENTQTRKTIKLSSASTPGFVPKLKPTSPPAPENATEAKPSDDTTTRTTIKLASNGAPQIVDPIAERKTDTGKLDKLDDTRTRKTVKLKPYTPPAAGEPGGVKPLKPKPLSTPVNKTTEKSSAESDDDTKTRTTVKLASSSDKTASDESDNAIITDPLSARDTDTGNIGKVLDDTRTKKTVKLKPLALKSNADKPQKLIPKTPEVTQPEAKSQPSAPPETAQGGAASDVKPPEVKTATGATAATEKDAVAATEKDAVMASPDKIDDTVKIARPKTTGGMAVELPLPTVASAKKVSEASKQTVKLSTVANDTPASGKDNRQDAASDKNDKTPASKATIKLTTPGENAGKPQPSTPEGSSSAAPKLTLPGLKVKSSDTGDSQDSSSPPAAQGLPKGGLAIKKKSAEEAEQPAKGPPRVQRDQERLRNIRKKTTSAASPAYTLMAILTLVLLSFTAAALAAQLHDMWHPELLIKEKLVEMLPYLSELVQ